MNPAHAGQAAVDTVYATLWFAALQAASDKLADPLPAHLDRVVATFFTAYPQRAKA